MALINENYLKLKAGYLFPEISRRVAAFQKENPGAKIIRLGIGDVTKPLAPSVVQAFQKAVLEMGEEKTFRGYGPEQGYAFLREAIVRGEFAPRGVQLDPDEIFISDGSKCDSGNITEIFGEGNSIAVTDPVYPVYVDTNVMAGRTGRVLDDGRCEGLEYLPMTSENGFVPPLPRKKADIIYLCSPNNPTGAVLSKKTLKAFVDYARKNKSVILFDAAYAAYIGDPDLPRSIFEVEGAREAAIEFRSFSKTAGFTGTRCAYIVIPKELRAFDRNGGAVALHGIWHRRHTTKFNGVSYPVQAAAAAIFSESGRREVHDTIAYYMENARLIREGLTKSGFQVYGGTNAPYIWLKTPVPSSWDFFDLLLKKANVVGTPGAGFGASGEGYFRLTAFGRKEDTLEALDRISRLSLNR